MGHRRRLCGRGRRLAGFAGAGCTVESVVGMSVDAAAGVRVVAKGSRDDDRDHDRDEDEGAATWNASTEVDHLLWYRAALSGRSPRRRCMRAPNRRGDRSKRSSDVGADAAAAQYRAGYCRTMIACRCVTTRVPVLRTCPAASASLSSADTVAASALAARANCVWSSCRRRRDCPGSGAPADHRWSEIAHLSGPKRLATW